MERLLTLPAVENTIGFKRSHIYDLVRENKFPAPVAIGTSRRWKETEVQDWISRQTKQNVAAESP